MLDYKTLKIEFGDYPVAPVV